MWLRNNGFYVCCDRILLYGIAPFENGSAGSEQQGTI
jgi:hypothetical protein